MPRAKERYPRASVGMRVIGSHSCLQETREYCKLKQGHEIALCEVLALKEARDLS